MEVPHWTWNNELWKGMMDLCVIHVKSLRAWGFFFFLDTLEKSSLEENDQGSTWLFIMIKVMIADICLTYSCFLNKPEVRVIRKTGYAAFLIPQAYIYIHTADSWRSGG